MYRRIAEIAPDVLRFDGATPVIPCFRDWYRLSRETSAVIATATLRHELHGWNERSIEDHREALKQQLEILVGDGEHVRWFFGPVGYILTEIRALRRPVPCRGYQGFWELPDEVERQVVAQLAEAA